jgi:hypothetical protein
VSEAADELVVDAVHPDAMIMMVATTIARFDTEPVVAM